MKKSILDHKRIKKISRKLVKLAAADVQVIGREAIKLAGYQLRIRPRIRLISKVVPVLILAYLASSAAVAYIQPREAEIKINGQAILVAEDQTIHREDNFEIVQTIDALRSPFLYEKPIDGPVSQGFRSYHRAIDITSPLGTDIKPVGPGIVEFAGFVPDGKGNVVIVDHGDGLKTLYAHVGKIHVGVGNVINTSDSLGTIGLTGRTTGPHVHFEVHDKGVQVNPENLIP